MSRIQFDLKIDLPRAIGSAWKVPIALRVLLQVVEVRRFIALLDAFEQREVQLEHLLQREEHAPDLRRLVGAGELGDVAVGGEVDVQLGPDGAAPRASSMARSPSRAAAACGR